MNSVRVLGGFLYQWDTGRQVAIESDAEIYEIHFANAKTALAYVLRPEMREGLLAADIPNVLLQDNSRIACWLVTKIPDGEKTIHSDTLYVTARKKPEDYVYTETEVLRYETLEKRVKDLEIKAVQADLSVNDPTDPRHVKNRTHYEEIGKTILPATAVTLTTQESAWTSGVMGQDFNLEVGKGYSISLNGKTYVCVYHSVDLGGDVEKLECLGNTVRFCAMMEGVDISTAETMIGIKSTSEPFFITKVSGAWMIISFDGITDLTVAINEEPIIHKLPNKYIDAEWMAKDEVVAHDAITWDGNLTGKEYIRKAYANESIYSYLVKITDYIPSDEEINAANCSFYLDGTGVVNVSLLDILDSGENVTSNDDYINFYLSNGESLVLIVKTDVGAEEFGVASTGVYFSKFSYTEGKSHSYTVSLSIPYEETITPKLPEKFLPGGLGGDAPTPRIELTAEDTEVELQPNALYVFPEMTTLTYTLAPPANASVVNEYHFIFASGSAATEVVHPEGVIIGDFEVDANEIYEVSILENCLASRSWAVE